MQLMAAAPQIQGAAPKQGVPSPLLILSFLLLLPGSMCQDHTYSTSPPRLETTTSLVVNVTSTCNTSVWPQEVLVLGMGREVDQNKPGLSTLRFQHLEHNHSGLYFCRVEVGGLMAQSCGTFVRVDEPMPVPFLNLRDATKNRILTAQGVLLLLCAAGPGLLLLFRKRWANERLLQPKKISIEEENLYEGLNLDECSMYEDISRGVQPTYQDVGTLATTDSLLEKP
ncbi:B-cell antigen receptor complex-associated protein alpha chain isoform X3 [Hirundo rustica]|uniref:B-cell antigen receptor complex-associated protein alpha chain isoform X3 n=1 Tax=Hirundo rustica TaxID=43150 RepID=UPI001A94FD76|nr:B-cell antigen receptor complex-associated protein alpha chain isoform X3 [Hirundo rustica]